MNEKEFYAQILARVIIDAGAAVIVGGEDSDAIIGKMVQERCCEALKDIRDILDDDTLSDEACFGRIDRIVSIYETLGPGGGSRHSW